LLGPAEKAKSFDDWGMGRAGAHEALAELFQVAVHQPRESRFGSAVDKFREQLMVSG
jgi:hypothetical protein